MGVARSWRLGVTPDEMREIDRIAEADFAIQPLQLMEVAGLQVARAAARLCDGVAGKTMCILAGKGNNGADGLVAARRLAGWGARVEVLTSYPLDEASGMSAGHLRTLRKSSVVLRPWAGVLPAADLYVDALLGFGSRGAPRGSVEQMIGALPPGEVLAVDVPSGLDAGTGDIPGACVRAEQTVTLALTKVGLLAPAAASHVGLLLLADIGVPRELIAGLGIDTAGLFETSDLEVLVAA
ncbi:MAG: NAD(P)H-hydrate epimerase [Candidatus Dormibacteria bacterium]